MSAGDPADSPELAALADLGRDAVKRPTAAELDHGLDLLRSRIVGAPARRRTLVLRSLAGVAAVGCVLVGAKLSSSLVRTGAARDVPVSVQRIEGGSILEGGYLSQSGPTGIGLFFNEGSEVLLMPGARGRLRATATDGARLAIERGTASFQITPGPARRWWVEAGPFLVAVKGTVFTVSWDAASERFELRLRHGRVVVSGPVVGDGVTLRAGQRLSINLPKAETVIQEEPPENATAPAGGTGPSSAETGPPARTAASSPTGRTATPPGPAARALAANGTSRRWAAELANGHWDRILSDVDREGTDAALAKASSEDLFAIADAARYRRRADLARAALLAQRRRFPRSPRALDAMFLLGRVEELREQGGRRAIELYDEYLTLAPAGAFAGEALGRKMILLNEMGGPARARPIAEEYLVRFPSGSYAGSARALTRAP